MDWLKMFAFLVLALIKGGVSLVCYSCTATLSSAIDPSGQMALRVFLDSTYNLPAVHRLCNMEDDVEFRTIHTSQCATNDDCVKVSAENHGIAFVVRGCRSQIYKSNVGVQEVPCQAASPSICYCTENLCNATVDRNTAVSSQLLAALVVLYNFA